MLKIFDFMVDKIKKSVIDMNLENVYYYALNCLKEDSVFGAVHHPGKKMHSDASDELADFISKII